MTWIRIGCRVRRVHRRSWSLRGHGASVGASRRYHICHCMSVANVGHRNDGNNANGHFLTFFVEHCGGMIQADGEGVYEGAKLILPLK